MYQFVETERPANTRIMPFFRRATTNICLLIVSCLLVAACGGSSGSRNTPPPAPTFTISAEVDGLNAGDAITVAIGQASVNFSSNGSQVLVSDVSDGTSFEVMISSIPVSLQCSAAEPSGSLDGANATIQIACSSAIQFGVGGEVTGLATGDSITLALHGVDLSLEQNGSFEFPEKLFDTEAYVVTQSAISHFAVCTITNASGTIAQSDATDVAVQCQSKIVAPLLMQDVNTLFTDNGTDLDHIIGYQGGALFRGGPDESLWVSDGTPAGSRRVLDVGEPRTGPPQNFIEAGGVVYFVGEPVADDHRLWRTDGTAAGTSQVSDVVVSSQSNIVGLGSTLFFIGIDPQLGPEIFISDGTASGTKLLREIVPGTNTSPVSEQFDSAVSNDRLIFSAREGNNLRFDVWSSDGTTAGTQKLTDFETTLGASISSISGFTAFNGQVYFWVSDQLSTNITDSLWRTDGTAAGTEEVQNFAADGSGGVILGVGNGSLYFAAPENSQGLDLARYDGSVVTRINVNPAGPSILRDLVATSSGVYFRASAPFGGTGGLYLTQGTEATTQLVVNNDNVSNFSALPWEFDNAYIYSRDGDLWRLDGSASTRLFESEPVGFGFGGVFFFSNDAEPEARLFFPANDRLSGNELWVSDGTSAGTLLAANTVAETTTENGTAEIVGETNEGIYFVGVNQDNEVDLWFSDGTAAGTQVRDIVNGGDLNVSSAKIAGTNVIFNAQTINGPLSLQTAPLVGGTAVEILSGNLEHVVGEGPFLFTAGTVGQPATAYLSDLTPTGTALISDLAGSDPIIGGNQATVFDGIFAFDADINGDRGLYTFDPTNNALAEISSAAPFDGPLVEVSGQLIWSSSIITTSQRIQLWSSDGTSVGSQVILDPVESVNYTPGPTSSINAIGSRAYFVSRDENGSEPWVTDGTSAGTFMLVDANQPPPGSNQPAYLYSSGTSNFGEADGTVYFSTSNPDTQIWATDGTVARTRTVSLSGLNIRNPYSFCGFDGLVYFLGRDANDRLRVWVTDGQSETRSFESSLEVRSGTNLFCAENGEHSGIYAQADDGTTGNELYRLTQLSR